MVNQRKQKPPLTQRSDPTQGEESPSTKKSTQHKVKKGKGSLSNKQRSKIASYNEKREQAKPSKELGGKYLQENQSWSSSQENRRPPSNSQESRQKKPEQSRTSSSSRSSQSAIRSIQSQPTVSPASRPSSSRQPLPAHSTLTVSSVASLDHRIRPQPVIQTLDPKVWNLRELITSDRDTEVDVSSNSQTRNSSSPANMCPPSVNDRYQRRVVFVSAAEADATGLTKSGEEMVGKVGAALSPVSIYYSAVIIAPTVPCFRTARIILNSIGAGSFTRNNIFVEPGLLDAFDRQRAIVDDERPFLSLDAMQSAMMPENPITSTKAQQPPVKILSPHALPTPDTQRLPYLPFTTRADVRAEKTYLQFENRVTSTIQHIVISQRGCLLVILDAGPLDAALRALVGLPRLTVRDYQVVVNGGPNRPPAIPPGCVTIVEQPHLGGNWEVRHKFNALVSSGGHRVEIDMAHLKRNA
ncbi:unnamed protein product, partial [Mesorhabditis belari]|uniref:BRCT domain-containing protein n=1 Tax=Mesorhabditis belari TaxID=2138241 RepID=A0AAF3ESM5_9BILA